MAKAKTEVAQREPLNMAVIDEKPDYIDDSQKRGSEGVGIEDVLIPRLELVQSTSPVRKKSDPAYIEGAEDGMLFNTVTRKLYGSEVYVVPVIFRKEFNVWVKRVPGKSTGTSNQFRGSFQTNEQAEAKVQELGGNKEFEVIDTPQHFCLVIDKETGLTEQIVVSMPRTKNKVSRKWNSLVQLTGGDRFSRVYKLWGVPEENDKGDYYNFGVMAVGYPPRAIYDAALDLYNKVKSGMKLKAAPEDDGEGSFDDPDTPV